MNTFNQPSQRRGMFGRIVEKANNTANSETAKKIRKHLIIWGSVAAAIGAVLFISSIVIFFSRIVSTFNTDMSSSNFGSNFVSNIVLMFVLFAVGGFILGIGVEAIRAGLAIVIAGFATKTLDVNDYCPNCKSRVDGDEIYCSKCGANLRANKLCECGFQNDLNDTFCRKCGKKL